MEKIDPDSSVPLYLQLRNLLREQILSGDIRESLPKEHDLCKKYGISRRTASRAVKMLADAGLVRRIKSKGTLITTHPQKKHEGNIGLVFPLTDGWNDALRTMRAEIARMGRTMVFYPYEWFDVQDEKRALLVAASNCDGVILYPNGEQSDRELIAELRRKGYPLVLFDLFYEDCDCSFVAMNNFLCASRLTEVLIKSPEDRIAIVESYNYHRHITVLQRVEGFYKTLERLGIKPDRRLELKLYSFDHNKNMEKIIAFLRKTSPDGLFITDQNCLPMSALSVEEFRKIRVSTIGQHLNYSRATCSRFDYAEQPEEEIGRTAIKLLDEKIADRTSPASGVFVAPRFHWHEDR